MVESVAVRQTAGSRRTSGWRFLAPLGFVVLLLPITVVASLQSLAWIGTTFPGFFLMQNRVVASVSGVDWPARRENLFHRQVVGVDGETVADAASLYARVAGAAPGQVFAYDLREGVATRRVAIAARVFSVADFIDVYGILLAIAGLNLVLGAIVGFLQPSRREARAYLVLCFFGCLFAATATFLHRAESSILTMLYLTAESFFPAAFIYFALCFPVDRWARRVVPWGCVPFVFAAGLTAAKMRGFYGEPPVLTTLYVSYVFMAAGFVVFLASLVAGLRSARDVQARLRTRALLPSVAVGSGLCVYAFLENSLSGGSVPMQLGLVLVPLFYASVAYAIVAHDLFGIDRFVRWTFVYVLLSGLVYAAYSLLVSGLPELARHWGIAADVALGLGFVALAILLEPLRRVVQRIVDRTYFRTPWDYRATIGRVSREMTGWRSIERIVDELTRVLTVEMQLESVIVVDGATKTAWKRSADGGLTRLLVSRELDTMVGRLPADLTYLTREQALSLYGAVAFFGEHEIELVFPMTYAGRVTGVLALGPTQARRTLHADDLELLSTLAAQTAIALENARSYEALEATNRDLDELVRQRTAQLVQSEQLASLGQLVAGVAHELNNPVGAVYSSVETLELTLADLEASLHATADSQDVDRAIVDSKDLVAICREGSERVRGIVRDLLVFARSDRGERLPTDVREGLASTIRLLADRAERSETSVEFTAGDIPLLQANPAQLNQVWMNLLTNALDAVAHVPPAHRLVRVGVHRADDGSAIVVSVQDAGDGMSESTRAHLFEPFFTTKEVGKGTGLGMSIAYGIVRDHGGRIDVNSTLGVGTEVRVWLPSRQAA